MKKNNNKDYTFIASEFDKENVNAPDELTFDSIINNSGNNKIIKFKRKNKFAKAAISMVACIAIIACSVASVNTYYDEKYNNTDEIISFSSYHQINSLIRRINGFDYDIAFPYRATSKFDYAISDEIAYTNAIDEGLSLKGDNFSQTNVQVDTVDEADIVKTDGEYIYYLNDYEITIYKADGKNSKQVGIIKDYYSHFSEMYILGNRLISISGNDVSVDDSDMLYSSTVCIYDITDKANPVLEDKFSQSGSYTSSRMIGDYLYLVSSYSVYNKELPFVSFVDESAIRLSYKDIYCMPCPQTSGFIVVSAIDINDVKSKTKTKAILGCNNDIYCSNDNLYLLNQKYENSRKKHIGGPVTNIIRVSLDGLKLDFTGNAKVKGYVENQYSLDESDGYLRVATSDFNANNLFVLDSKMKEVGAVKNFAQGESIQAVRYIDNYAYVITFEQTDPLFIIDLSDPESPKITGSVKITGFSDNLIPVDDNTLLGVGYAGTADCIKLALFDISDKNNPTVLDSKIYYKYRSDAQSNIKALLINRHDGYFGFAYNVYGYLNTDYDEEGVVDKKYNYKGGILTFEVKNSKLKETHDFKSKNGIFLNRCVYIDDQIYALTEDEEMLVFDMKK